MKVCTPTVIRLEMKKMIPLTVAPRRESIGTELTKEVEQVYSENHKLSRKRRQISGKTACVYGLGNLILLKCQLCLKQSTHSDSVKNPAVTFAKMKEPILKFPWNLKGILNIQNSLETAQS